MQFGPSVKSKGRNGSEVADVTPIRYSLSRGQRLIPHLHIWGFYFTPFIVTLVAFFVARLIAMTIVFNFKGIVVFGILAISILFLFRGLFIGLIDIVLTRRCEMDITIEDKAMGVMLGTERFYLFLDGVTSISRFHRDIWTVQHWNGSVVHILASALPGGQLQHLQDMMQFGRTPEGVATVVERGKVITNIIAADRKAEQNSKQE